MLSDNKSRNKKVTLPQSISKQQQPNNKPGENAPPISYLSPKPKQKKVSLTIDIEEELARLELDDFVNSLEKGKGKGLGQEGVTGKIIRTRNAGNTRPELDEHEKDGDKSMTQIQANGSIGGQLGRDAGKIPDKRKVDILIPGSVNADASALRSQLITAVEKNKIEKVKRILSAGIDANAVCDEKGRWPLHIAAFFGYCEIAKLLLEHGAQKDQPDTTLERTPLLYAASTSPDIVQLLLNYKADTCAVNRFGATCLHYAAGSGQSECCKILAAYGCDVNAKDKQKMTPLHMAARVDDIWSIEVLLEFGADINAKDIYGKTALHHAAETSEGMVSDYKKMVATFRRLVAAGIAINEMDNDGKTALYYAIQTGSPDACTILHELGAEVMDGVSVLAMSRKFPALIRPFLDKCLSSNIATCDPESKHFYIQFDYTCLSFYPKDIPDEKLQTLQHREETESILQEMGVLYALTWCKDTSILSHPVCESLLRLKWKKVKWYLYLDMLLFAVFLAFLTAVIFMEYESDSTQEELAMNNMTDSGTTGESHPDETRVSHNRTTFYCMDTPRTMSLWIILWILTACLGIREMVQLLQAPLNYIVQVENILELVLVFSVAMLSLAECGVESFIDTRDHFAAVCLIVGWTIQVTLYGKIPVFGVYIRQFAVVAVNILKCIFTYLGLLFAFSLTLHFLFRSQKEFDSVGFTFLKTFAMMIGEIELVRTFIEKDATKVVPVTSHLIIALFIIFISVILMSLLIALAVADIASMQRDGEYMQLVQQVKVASQLEDALQRRALLYPQYGMKDMKSLHQRKGVIFPNMKDHGKLGKDALEIVITQHTRKMDASHANVISQQIHPTVENNDAISKLGNQTTRTTNEIADDLMLKLKSRMDMYTREVERRNDKLLEDYRTSTDRGSLNMTRELVGLRKQVDDMQEAITQLGSTVHKMTQHYSHSRDDSSLPRKEKQSRRKPSIDATTANDANTNTSSGDATESSSDSSEPTSSKVKKTQNQPA